MNTVSRDIFQAIHEDKWLSIEYKNKEEEITKYWIGMKAIQVEQRCLLVEGFHLTKYTTQELKIYLDSILSSHVVEGSYYQVPRSLKEDIYLHPARYSSVFSQTANLKILNYLADCNRLDGTPYKTDYALIEKLDADVIGEEGVYLTREQMGELIRNFQMASRSTNTRLKIKQLALNVLSIPTKQGLYVLAHRKLRLDVKNSRLIPAEELTICSEFTIGGTRQSIRRFLDAEDYELLEEPEVNLERIKNRITETNPQINGVDDRPYLIALGMEVLVDLHSEYAYITELFEKGEPTVPLQAFFGEMLKAPGRRKDSPIALLSLKVNLDQLLAIHNAMKYPLTYVQGPPGTGKTSTIVNTLVTAFFNEKTVLFSSYNNHPIDGVCEKLMEIPYLDKIIPFPMIRLGNDDKVRDALLTMRRLYEETQNIKIFSNTLDRRKDKRISKAKELTALLKRHEEKLDLLERKEALQKLWEENQRNLHFQTHLTGVQLAALEEKLGRLGEITEEEALKLVVSDEEEFKKYLYYTSAKYIKRLGEPKNEDLRKIIYHEKESERVKLFNGYLSKEENVKKFLRIFPIVATTSMSAHKIGEPKTYFDMTIMDEASQGNIAISLLPVLRGKNLMLVGDPQQLNPVILLDPKDNARLRKIYHVPEEYDYIKNSIYKTYLACDAISEEILLSHHYRCDRKIIEFNNRKYYHNKLVIDTEGESENPLVFWDMQENTSSYKNTAPKEAAEIVDFIQKNPDKSIGIITPFTNQKEYLNTVLRKQGIDDVTCGTVHAFQGDEKDIILFSLALTDKTHPKTYGWLKNNKELINVATSRAKEQLIVVSSRKELERLHSGDYSAERRELTEIAASIEKQSGLAEPEEKLSELTEPAKKLADRQGMDDMYELVQYVESNGTSQITARASDSRALGIKPYSMTTERIFFDTLNHALGNVLNTEQKCEVKKDVEISEILPEQTKQTLFSGGQFDFVVYEKEAKKAGKPILAIELAGREPFDEELAQERSRQKEELCRQYGVELIHIENSYARRYNYIKEILITYFKNV